MATMRTKLSGTETTGEKKLYHIFRTHFSDDYHVWHNVVFPNMKDLEVDFIVVHPSEGIYLIEVKDWHFHKILSADSKKVLYETDHGKTSYTNPFYQARNNGHALRNALEKIPCFRHSSGRYENKLAVAVNTCVAFPNIYSDQLKKSEFSNNLPPDRILDESFFTGKALTDRDYEKLLAKQKNLDFNFIMSNVHWTEIGKLLGTPVINDPITSDQIGVVDEVQESLITFDINTQLLVEGPAGSGKSVILIKRAAYMHQQNPQWKIGVFCFNTIMANYLKTLANSYDLSHKIFVSDFGSIKVSKNNRHSYDAILIDEGQDLNDKHLAKIRHLLKPTPNALTIFYDPNQALYTRDDLEQLLIASGLNIDFEKKLVKQQRSIHFALALSLYNALTNPDLPFETSLNESKSLLERYFSGYKYPVSAVASGTARHFSNLNTQLSAIFKDELANKVQIQQHHSVNQMINDFAVFIKECNSVNGTRFSDFMIIYPYRVLGKQVIPKIASKVLQSFNIPYRIIAKEGAEYFNHQAQEIYNEQNNLSSAPLTDNVVKICNIFQAKGQDAKHVAVIGFENITHIQQDPNTKLTEAQLLKLTASRAYILTSRATSKLYIFYAQETPETKLLTDIITNL